MKKRLLLFAIIFSLNTFAQPGALDQSFNNNKRSSDYQGSDGSVYSLALQPDFKILIGGDFTQYNGIARNGIARLYPDGTLDTSFNPGIGLATRYYIKAIVLQPDGKVIIGGYFLNKSGGYKEGYIARLNLDGSLDSAFNVDIYKTLSKTLYGGEVNSIQLQPDGKIIIAGNFSNLYTGTEDIVRLNADGTFDTSFNAGTGTEGSFARLSSIALQTDGKIIVGGQFTSFNGISRRCIARLNTDGSLDTTCKLEVDNVTAMVLQSNGKIVLGGDLGNANGKFFHVARFDVNTGILDSTFDPSTIAAPDPKFGACYIRSLIIAPAGEVIVGGIFSIGSSTNLGIARLKASGILDTTFFKHFGEAYAAVRIPGGKIIVGGFIGANIDGVIGNNEVNAFFDVGQLDASGTIDSSFNLATGTDGTVLSTKIQPDGKIIIGGNFTKYKSIKRNNIARLNPDGTLDESFNPGTGADYKINSVVLQPDGKIIIGGMFTRYNGIIRRGIARLNNDGSLDTSFDPSTALGTTGGFGNVTSVALQPDGKIIIGGTFKVYTGTNPTVGEAIMRLNADGSEDMAFNNRPVIPGVFGYNIYSIVLQPDGKIIIGGAFTNYDYTLSIGIARLNSDGNLDTDFRTGNGTSGIYSNSPYVVRSILIQPNGKIIIAGDFSFYNDIRTSHIIRLNADGTLDNTFKTGDFGKSDGDYSISSVLLQPDGKFIVAGNFNSISDPGPGLANIRYQNAITLLNADGSFDRSFNPGKGKSIINSIAQQPDGKIIIAGDFTDFAFSGRNYIARLNGGSILGNEQYNFSNKLNIYPNPTTSELNLNLSKATSINKIIITDLTGKQILQQSDKTNQVNVQNLAKGMYILQAYSGKEKFTSKFIKE